MDEQEARAALDAMQQAQDKLAVVADCPPWRHAAFGGVQALMMLAFSARGALFGGLFVIAMALVVWVVQDDRRRTGTFVNGWRRGRTLPLSLGLAAGLLALARLAMQGRGQGFPSVPGLTAALAAFVLGVAASVWWQRIYLAELRGGARP